MSSRTTVVKSGVMRGWEMPVLWVLLALSFLAAFVPADIPGLLALLVGWIPVVFAFWHLSRWAGGWNAVGVFVIIAVVSFIVEALGVATGLVFGNYYYPDGPLGPLVLGVPPLIQLQYFAMGYACLMMARSITGTLSTVARGWVLWAGAIIGAFGMTALDLSSDPMQSTVLGDWIWRDGGAYFGVPIHNFVGWFVETFIFFVLVQFFLTRPSAQARISAAKPRGFFLAGILLAGTFPFAIIVRPFLIASSEITHAMAGVAAFAVVPMVFIALVTLARSTEDSAPSEAL